MPFLLAFSFFIYFSENLSISSLSAIQTVPVDETTLIINHRSFFYLYMILVMDQIN